MDNLEIMIGKYKPEDRDAVRKICCDTGFWGKPIDDIFLDRELFADIIIEPYLWLEPEHTFVARDNGKVVGYLSSAIRKGFEKKRALMVAASALEGVWKTMTGGYSYRSRQFARWMLEKGWRQIPKHPKTPAHVHINLAEGYRGKDVGPRMVKEFEKMLLENGISHYYAEVFSSEERRSMGLYKRFGFAFFDKVETEIFKPEIEDTLYVMCIHKQLNH